MSSLSDAEFDELLTQEQRVHDQIEASRAAARAQNAGPTPDPDAWP